MTQSAKVGLKGTGRISQGHAENTAFRIPEFELVATSDLVVEPAEKYTADYPSPTLFNDCHPFLANNSFGTVPICLNTNTHAQLIKEPGSTHSISFPPFCCWEQEVTPAPAILLNLNILVD